MRLLIIGLASSALLCLATALPVSAQESVPWAEPAPVSVEEAIAYHRTYQRAFELYAQDRFEEAIPLLEALVERQPGDPGLWGRLGRALEVAGRAEDAIEAYGTALDIGYRFTPWIAHRIALQHAEAGRADSAIAWIERALAERWDDRPSIGSEPAFEALRRDPRFPELGGELPDREFTRDEGWRYDLDFLVQEAQRMHVGPDRPAFSETFDSAATSLRERIPELSNDRIVLELRRLLILLGDGHTGIYGPGPDSPLAFESGDLPLLFYRFDDGLFVVDAGGEAQRWIGSRVTAFGPLSVEEVLDALPTYTYADNPMSVTWIGVRWTLRSTAFLEAIGATEEANRATLTLRDGEGREHRVTFTGGDHEFRRKLRPPRDAHGEPPLYLSDVDREYWLEPLPEHDALYFQFNQVRNAEEGPSLAAFADTLRTALERTEADHLIVDVRHNNGGNNGLLRPLVRTMVWWEQAAPGNQLIVLAGRNTFSAAQNFLNRVERWTDAVFAGEPSSSRPNFSGEETNVVLPYSRLRATISTLYWQDSDPGDRRPWIAPRIPVTLSSEDYFDNRDPVLEAALRVVNRGRP
jgi:tetratricopeptide (TPR) repeat protein